MDEKDTPEEPIIRAAPEETPTIPEMGPNDRFVYEGMPLVPMTWSATHFLFHKEGDPTLQHRISHLEIHLSIDEGRAKFTRNYHTKVGTKAWQLFGDTHIQSYTARQQRISRFHEALIFKYEDYCKELGDLIPRSEKIADKMPGGRSLTSLLEQWTLELQISPTVENLETGKVRKKRADQGAVVLQVPTVRSFNNYYAAYNGCGRDVRALVPRQKGPCRRHIQVECPESYAIWHATAQEFASSRKKKMAGLRKLANARIHKANQSRAEGQPDLVPVGRKRFENMIKQLEAFDVLAGQEGEDFAHAVFKPKMDSYDVARPGERVEFDDWNIDCITLMKETGIWLRLPSTYQSIMEKAKAEKPQRLWFTGAIDAATGKVLGLKCARKPCSANVIETLEMVMSDKTHLSELVGAKSPWTGKARPENVYTDNGTPYIADNTRDAFLMSGVSLTRPPAGQAWKRPFIEALFRTFTRDLMSFFDGRTFANVVEKGNYNAVANATLIIDEFINVVLRWLCDVFHNTPTEQLNWLSPNEAWAVKTKTYPMRPVPGRHERRHIFGTKREKPIRSEGIILHGIPYNSDALQGYRRKHGSKKLFPIRFHPRDLESISVHTEDGWLTVKNRIEMPPNICLEEWYLAKKELERLNAERSARSEATMYDGILWVHSVTDAAALRSRISPHVRSPEQMSRATEKLFEGRVVTKADAGDLSRLKAPAPQETALHQGKVDDLSEETLSKKVAKASDAAAETPVEYQVEPDVVDDEDDDDDSQVGEIEE